MKKEGMKRNSKPSKPRMKPREVLSELHFNLVDSRQPLRKKPRARVLSPFDLLPHSLHIEILGYFSARELLESVQLVSKEWKFLVETPIVWQWQEQRDIPIKYRIKHSKCLVERRSKGKVFRGTLRSSQLPVTVRKVLLDVTNAGFDDGVPTSMLREISYLSEIKHKNVAEFLGAELKGKELYIIHEQSEHNLKEFMKKYGQGDNYKMPRNVIQLLMKQLLQALQVLHQHRLMHRNLKPDNIMVTSDAQLKVTDFTLSKMASVPHGVYTPEDPKERDRSGREARRLWYRAPELLLRKEMYAFEIDMWTAGCILCELTLGQPLFDGDNEIEQLFKVFRFTGVPVDLYPSQVKAFPKWDKVNFLDILANKSSPEYRKLVDSLMPNRDSVLKSLSKLGGILGEDGLDLLQKLLNSDPSGRLTAVEALHHPFISGEPLKLSMDYMEQLHSWEKSNLCKEDYMPRQTNLTATMRSILIDWLIDVSVHFEVTDDTLHIAIGLIDRVLEKMTVDRTKLQLVGVTCMKIADVLNEKSKEYYRQENSIEYAYITADEYSPGDVVQMEKDILNLLNFRVLTPTILSFLKPYINILEVEEETAKVSLYLADLVVLSYETVKFEPSLLASVVLFLACCITEKFPQISTADIQVKYSDREFQSAVAHTKEVLLDARSNPVFSRYESINHKFQAINPHNIWPPANHHVHPWLNNDK